MLKQFTATVYIIKDQKVLLIFHKKFKKWLPPGGHLENETPNEGARREVLEETGLQIEFITQENVWINQPNASSINRPYLCLLEEIPAFGSEPAHQHIDFIYLAMPVGGKEFANLREIDELRWFALEEIEALTPEIDIFNETVEVIRTIIKTPSNEVVYTK